MRVTILGAGFVGVATAVAFAEANHQVSLVEVDRVRRERLAAGFLPFHEEGLDEAYRALRGRGAIAVSDRLAPVLRPEVIYLAVGTPSGRDGAADLAQVRSAAREVGRFIAHTRRYLVVAVKSTVPPGTTRDVVYPILSEEAGDVPFGLVAAPEFLREGSALQDARRPSRIVIGALDERAAAAVRRLHQASPAPLLTVAPETAELVKYASNAFLAIKVAFANEMGNLAERLGLDIDEVMAAVALDPRISPHFLQAGLGFGGSCFPKDVAALRALARGLGADSRLLDATMAHNEAQPLRAVALAREALAGLAGRRVALLGLAFKPGTSDARESRALPIHHALLAEGAEVVCYDPVASPSFVALSPDPVRPVRSAREALAGADAAIIQTAWPEFRTLAPDELRTVMRNPLIIDGRRVLDASACRKAGLDHRPIGDGTGRYHESRDPSRRPRDEVPARDEERPEGDVAPVGPPGHPVRG